MLELLDKGVVFKANDRLRDKVPEDPANPGLPVPDSGKNEKCE
jgi:hypothetical protein